MRSLATRDRAARSRRRLPEVDRRVQAAGFDLVIVETSGIGQGDAAIVPLADVSLYVMTPEFGAASQLEKIDMLDFADFVAINKFDRSGAEDALRDVRKQVQRNRELFAKPPDEMPVFGTIAARFNDDGVTALYQAVRRRSLQGRTGPGREAARCRLVATQSRRAQPAIVPPRAHALPGRDRRRRCAAITRQAEAQATRRARTPGSCAAAKAHARRPAARSTRLTSIELMADRDAELDGRARSLLDSGRDVAGAYSGDEYVVKVRDKRDPHPRSRAVPVRHHDPQGRAAALSRTTARSCAGCCARTCPASFPSPPAFSRSSARTRTRRACSPAKAIPSAPTGASSCCPKACRRSACRPRSTR